MKRVIVDYQKLDQNLLALLVEKFPLGYDETDIITFRNSSYELIEAVEVKTEDTIYLVKISKRLADTMASFDLDDSEESESLPDDDIEEEDDDS